MFAILHFFTLNTTNKPLALYLALDVSKSMAGEKLKMAKEVITKLIDRLSEEIAEHIDNDIIDRLRNAGWEYERTVQELNQDIPTMRG